MVLQYICCMSEAVLQVTLKILTTQREIQGGGPKHHAVLLVDGHLPVSTQVVKTALKPGQTVSQTRAAHKSERVCTTVRECAQQ